MEKMTNSEHVCSESACCACGCSLKRTCEYASSIVVTMRSPMMQDDGQAVLCFSCACKVNELIHPDLLNDSEYIAAKDQVLAHRATHDRRN